MASIGELTAVPPVDLAAARALAHAAVQFATRAARANLDAAADDSHSNLGWDIERAMLKTHPMTNEKGVHCVGVSFAPLGLHVLTEDQAQSSCLLDGQSTDDIASWLDQELEALDLEPASKVALTYALPQDVSAIVTYLTQDLEKELATLAAWFDLAERTLDAFQTANEALKPGPSPVRCWPHHFDIATYVGLESQGGENAKGIGVGMSPGDENYDQPYFYVNPWPHLAAGALPGAPPPGHWHRDGFVGLIATGSNVLDIGNVEQKLPLFLEKAFAIGRQELGL